jgi:septal ring factor EnvC (AmiA/AmiB activator)
MMTTSSTEIQQLKEFIGDGFNRLDDKLEKLTEKVESIDKRLVAVETKLDSTEKRLGTVETEKANLLVRRQGEQGEKDFI